MFLGRIRKTLEGNYMSFLTIGIPNGSLYKKTIELFEKLGIEIITNGRSFEAEVIGTNMFKKALIMRPQSMPEAIKKGIIDCGICGRDCVVESGMEKELIEVAELNYSKISNRPVKIVVFGKKDFLEDNKETTVYSEYPNITKEFFKKANIVFSYGTTEAQVVAGTFDYGVCVVETGKSIRDNDLYILETLLISPTVLITKEELPKIEILGKLLKGALKSEKYQLVKMNVAEEIKEKIISMLPSLSSPTVNDLADGSFAIETIVEKSSLSDLLIQVKQAGARDLVVLDMNIIL